MVRPEVWRLRLPNSYGFCALRLRYEAEPRMHCVPRRSLGTSGKTSLSAAPSGGSTRHPHVAWPAAKRFAKPLRLSLASAYVFRRAFDGQNVKDGSAPTRFSKMLRDLVCFHPAEVPDVPSCSEHKPRPEIELRHTTHCSIRIPMAKTPTQKMVVPSIVKNWPEFITEIPGVR